MTDTPNRDMPAFGALAIGPAGDLIGQLGMTKRELVAMAVLQGLCASGGGMAAETKAQMAVSHADALLEELAK